MREEVLIKSKAWVCDEVRGQENVLRDEEFKEILAAVWELLLNKSCQPKVLSFEKPQSPSLVRDSETKRSASK